MAQQHPRHPFAAYFVTGRFADAVLSVRQEKDADDGDACAASVEVERVPVHRIVLAAQSSVLDALFASCASLPSAPCAAKREPTFSQPQKQDHAEGEQPSTFESASIPAVPTLSTAPEFQHIQLKPLPDSVLTPSHSYALSLPVVPLLLPNATNSQALRAVLEWAYFGRLSHASLSLGSIFELLRLAEILRVDALYVHARGWLEHLLRGSFSDNQLDAFLSQDMILGVANKEPISAMNPARLPQCPRLASEWASAVVSAVRTSTHADLLVRVLAAAVRDIKSFPEASDSSLSGQNNESFSELQQDIELVLRVSKDHSDSFITYRFVRNICTTWQDKFDDPLNADHVMTLLNLIDYEQFAVPELEVLNKDVTHDRVPKQIAFKAFMLAVKKRESSVPRNPSSSEIPVADMYLGAPGAQTGILGDHFDPLTITAAKSTLSKEKLEAQKGGCCVLSPLAISQSPATVSASTSTTSLLAFAIPEDGNETIRPDTINNPSRRAVASSSKKQRPPLSRSLFIPVHSANDVELKEFSSPTSSEPASHQTVSAMTNAPTTSRFNSAGFSSNGFSARSNLADSCNDEYVVASSFEEFRLAANVAGQAERKDQTSADGSNSNESFDQISATASSLFNSAARAIHQQFFGKTKSEEEVTAVSADTADTSKLDEDEGNLTAIYVGPRSIESGCDEFTVENVTTSEPQEAMSVAATIIPATNANSITCSAGSADNLQPKSKKGSADIELSSRASSLPAALVSSSRIYRLPVPSFSEMNSGSNHVNTSRAATLSGPVAPSQSSKPIQHSVLPQLRRHTMSVPSTTELLDAVSQKLTRLIEKGHIDVVAEVEDGRQVHDIQYSGNRSAESEKMELAPTLGALRDVTKPISVLSFNARHGIDIARTGISDSQVETVRLPIEKRWAQVSGNVEEMNHRNTVSEARSSSTLFEKQSNPISAADEWLERLSSRREQKKVTIISPGKDPKGTFTDVTNIKNSAVVIGQQRQQNQTGCRPSVFPPPHRTSSDNTVLAGDEADPPVPPIRKGKFVASSEVSRRESVTSLSTRSITLKYKEPSDPRPEPDEFSWTPSPKSQHAGRIPSVRKLPEDTSFSTSSNFFDEPNTAFSIDDTSAGNMNDLTPTHHNVLVARKSGVIPTAALDSTMQVATVNTWGPSAKNPVPADGASESKSGTWGHQFLQNAGRTLTNNRFLQGIQQAVPTKYSSDTNAFDGTGYSRDYAGFRASLDETELRNMGGGHDDGHDLRMRPSTSHQSWHSDSELVHGGRDPYASQKRHHVSYQTRQNGYGVLDDHFETVPAAPMEDEDSAFQQKLQQRQGPGEEDSWMGRKSTKGFGRFMTIGKKNTTRGLNDFLSSFGRKVGQQDSSY